MAQRRAGGRGLVGRGRGQGPARVRMRGRARARGRAAGAGAGSAGTVPRRDSEKGPLRIQVLSAFARATHASRARVAARRLLPLRFAAHSQIERDLTEPALDGRPRLEQQEALPAPPAAATASMDAARQRALLALFGGLINGGNAQGGGGRGGNIHTEQPVARPRRRERADHVHDPPRAVRLQRRAMARSELAADVRRRCSDSRLPSLGAAVHSGARGAPTSLPGRQASLRVRVGVAGAAGVRVAAPRRRKLPESPDTRSARKRSLIMPLHATAATATPVTVRLFGRWREAAIYLQPRLRSHAENYARASGQSATRQRGAFTAPLSRPPAR